MRIFLSILTLALISFLTSPPLHAQDDDQGYAYIEYMKVKPGMMSKYRECEKAWKLIHQYRVDQGLIEGWELEEVLIPSGTGTEYDFLTITHYKNWEAMGSGGDWYDAAMETLPADLKEVAENAAQFRDLVRTEVWTAGDMAFPESGGDRPRYLVDNFMKIPAQGWGDWIEMETTFVKPVHEKNIALGNRAGWVMAFMVQPHGESLSYQASTIDYYDSWGDMDKDEGEAWEMVYPNMSYDEINERITSTRTLVRTEVRMLVDFVE